MTDRKGVYMYEYDTGRARTIYGRDEVNEGRSPPGDLTTAFSRGRARFGGVEKGETLKGKKKKL